MSLPPIGPIAAASAWGAKNGPGIIRRVQDGGRTWQAALLIVGYAIFGALLLAAWLVLVVSGLPLISLAFGIAALSAVVVVSESVARWWWHPRSVSGPVLATSPAGAPATAWLRSRAALIRPVGLLVMLVLCAVGEVVAGVVGDHPWAFVTPVLLVGLAGWLAVPFLRRRVSAGGLYLTPDGIEHVWGSAVAEGPWSSVRLLPRTGPFGLRAEGLRYDGRGWIHQESAERVPGGILVPTAFLPSTETGLRRELEAYLASPEQRSALGAAATLDWFAARRGAEGTA